jgi:hypothetical protein
MNSDPSLDPSSVSRQDIPRYRSSRLGLILALSRPSNANVAPPMLTL